MPPHPLTNFEIQIYHQNKSEFHGIYSGNNLPKIKDGAYIINIDEYKSIGTNWIVSYVNAENVTYFDSFGVEYILRKVRKTIWNKNAKRNIYRIQAYDSIMCWYSCIGFIDFMLKGKSLLDYTNSFPPNDHEKNDEIILKYFIPTLGLSVISSKCKYEDKKIFKEEISIEILNIFGLIKNI